MFVFRGVWWVVTKPKQSCRQSDTLQSSNMAREHHPFRVFPIKTFVHGGFAIAGLISGGWNLEGFLVEIGRRGKRCLRWSFLCPNHQFFTGFTWDSLMNGADTTSCAFATTGLGFAGNPCGLILHSWMWQRLIFCHCSQKLIKTSYGYRSH